MQCLLMINAVHRIWSTAWQLQQTWATITCGLATLVVGIYHSFLYIIITKFASSTPGMATDGYILATCHGGWWTYCMPKHSVSWYIQHKCSPVKAVVALKGGLGIYTTSNNIFTHQHVYPWTQLSCSIILSNATFFPKRKFVTYQISQALEFFSQN